MFRGKRIGKGLARKPLPWTAEVVFVLIADAAIVAGLLVAGGARADEVVACRQPRQFQGHFPPQPLVEDGGSREWCGPRLP
jgi:hypothetical protein